MRLTYKQALRYHRTSYGLLPKNALNRLLKCRAILEFLNLDSNNELYRDNEMLISNYMEGLRNVLEKRNKPGGRWWRNKNA